MFEEVIKQDPDDRLVVFMGAASLGTRKKDEPKDLDDDKSDSIEEYNLKLTQMQNAGVTIRRYVSLIKPTDSPPARRATTQYEYVDWLNKQIEILESNPKYILIDCHRAQPWGGSRSSIVTNKALLDLVGDGESGFLIKGERICELLNARSRKLLEAANQTAYRGAKRADVDALERLKSQVQKSILPESSQ